MLFPSENTNSADWFSTAQDSYYCIALPKPKKIRLWRWRAKTLLKLEIPDLNVGRESFQTCFTQAAESLPLP